MATLVKESCLTEDGQAVAQEGFHAKISVPSG